MWTSATLQQVFLPQDPDADMTYVKTLLLEEFTVHTDVKVLD